MSHHENRAILERMMHALFTGDYEGAVADMAEDAVEEWPQSGERIVGREACLMVYRNYPGGSPTYKLSRISGEGNHFVVEATADYGGQTTLATNIVEFRDGKVARQTGYWSTPFEAPAWRAQWVERMEQV
jgi:ketosteroid isomerase-like protein